MSDFVNAEVSGQASVRPLTLEIEESGDVVVVRCQGKLISGVTHVLHSRVKKLIPGHKRIVLDLSQLTHMDSSGLGSLVGLFVSAKSAGCSLQLMNLSHGIEKVLSLTNLLSVFSVIGESGIKMG